MSLITLGTQLTAPGGITNIEQWRARFVRDLRKLYDNIEKMGLRQAFSSRSSREALKKLSNALLVATTAVGHDKVMRLVALLNDFSNRNAAYIELMEANKKERAVLSRVLNAAFGDAKAREQLEAQRGIFGPSILLAQRKSSTTMGGIGTLLVLAAAGLGVFYVARSFTRDGIAVTGQTLLDFFVRADLGTATSAEFQSAINLANSLALPQTAAAINASASTRSFPTLPSTEMWPGTGLDVRSYVNAYVRRINPSVANIPTSARTPDQAARDAVLNYALKQARYRLGTPAASPAPGAADKAAAVAGAAYLKLPFTSAAIAASTSSSTNWPSNEVWPGSGQAVNLFISEYLTRLGLRLGVPGMFGTEGSTMYKEIGRIVDVDGCGEEDMQGVYSTGIEEIVGAARAARAKGKAPRKVQAQAPPPRRRPTTFPPMRAQKVKGVPGYKPRVEIVDMPDMQIYSGPVDPRMQKLDPSTKLLLNMIRKDGPTRSEAAPIQRQRSIYPGSRGRYPY